MDGVTETSGGAVRVRLSTGIGPSRQTRLSRRGMMLVVAIAVITIAGALITFLAANSARYYREAQLDRVRLVHRAVQDSAMAYARRHRDAWSQTMPAGPIELDVQRILPPKVEGSATIRFAVVDGQLICRVVTRVERGRIVLANELDLPLR